MNITFFGHSSFTPTREYEDKVLDFLEEKLGDCTFDVYLGNNGAFDAFAYNCCKKYSSKHPNLSLIYVTPYMTLDFQKKYLNDYVKQYDGIIYPNIEDKPMRFAITYRNRFMIEKSDFVIVYVEHSWGGAYSAYKYALKKGKQIYNLANFQE